MDEGLARECGALWSGLSVAPRGFAVSAHARALCSWLGLFTPDTFIGMDNNNTQSEIDPPSIWLSASCTRNLDFFLCSTKMFFLHLPQPCFLELHTFSQILWRISYVNLIPCTD